MRSGIKALARIGYAARGLVYVVIGLIAVRAALGSREVEGTEGALTSILSQRFGTFLVILIGLGMVAFAVWRLVQAVRDTDNHGREPKGLAIRAALIGSAVSYAAVAFLAAGLVIGSRAEGGTGGDPSGNWLAAAHEAGVGWLVVYGVAALLFLVGAAHIVKGYRAGFIKYFRCGPDALRWLRPVGRLGLIARGVVFLILASLVFSGGLAYRAADRPGLDDALRAVQGYTFGWLILLAVALGLAAFGFYSLAEARYRHVSPT